MKLKIIVKVVLFHGSQTKSSKLNKQEVRLLLLVFILSGFSPILSGFSPLKPDKANSYYIKGLNVYLKMAVRFLK